MLYHYIILMITYCFLASKITELVGGTIGSVLVLIIVAFVCYITVVTIRKKRNRRNVKVCNTQQFELQTNRSLETSQAMTVKCSSRLLPEVPDVRSYNTQQVELQTIRSPEMTERPLPNTIELAHYPVDNHRRPPPYNKSSNTIGPHEAPTVDPCPYMVPYPQQPTASYPQHTAHHPAQQPPSLSSPQTSIPLYPYEMHAFNTHEMNQGRQPNTSAALTSFATLPTQNPIIQASRQHSSNVSNWEAPSDVLATIDNPAYEFLGAANGESDYECMDELYI